MFPTSLPLMTAEEFLQLGSRSAKHELIRGKLTASPLNDFQTGAMIMDLAIRIEAKVRTTELGFVVMSVGFVLGRNPDTVRAPAIAFISKATLAKTKDKTKYIDGAPELAIEVLSPSDSVQAIEEKAEAFLDAGAKLVWVVNPRSRRVWVYQPRRKPIAMEGDDMLEAEGVIPGFRIPVRDIFA